MTDLLVWALRKEDTTVWHGRRLICECSLLRHKAADEIERLRAKCNQRRDDLAQAREILDERFREIERLQKQNEHLRRLQEDTALRCLHQEDENKRLRKLTENDGREIGSYVSGTGLRGENHRLRDALERIANAYKHDSIAGDIAREALKNE